MWKKLKTVPAREHLFRESVARNMARLDFWRTDHKDKTKTMGGSTVNLMVYTFIIIIERLFIVKGYTIYITWLSKTIFRLWIDSFEACTYNYDIIINYHELQYSGRSCTFFSMCRSSFLSKFVIVSNHTDCTSQLSVIHTETGFKIPVALFLST